MEYRKWSKNNITTSLLGLGAMRLPKINLFSNEIDEIKSIKLIRYAIDKGINLIDTAYIYNDCISEEIVGKALSDGYREKVILSTKLPLWLVDQEQDFEILFNEQLKRLGTDYIDLFLFHALNRESLEKLRAINGFQFLDRKIQEGSIKTAGFSFHDDYSFFKELIEAYDWGACMLQFNFIDQDTQAGIEGIEYATKNKIPIIVMEPLKGGLLCTPPEEVTNIYNNHNPRLNSIAWSFKWIADFSGVKSILSGMSSINMIEENITYFNNCLSEKLTSSDKKMLNIVRNLYKKRSAINCTNCQYCLPCPEGVIIPVNFMIYNDNQIYDAQEVSQNKYNDWLDDTTSALNCTGCKLCEERCPQKIKISDILSDIKTEILSR